MQAYATWQVMRRLRASAAAAARPRTPTAHARNNIRAAAGLLAWLRGRGTDARRLRASRHRPLAAHRAVGLPGQGLPGLGRRARPLPAADHTPAAARRPAPPSARTSGGRWPPGCCTTTTLDPTDRVAGCLLLLYGQPLSRIAAMTTSQVTRRHGQTFIRLGRHDVPVPGPLADALRQLISGGRSYRGVGSPPATTWLFPGHLPGRPITPDTLGERLRALGIYAQTGRRAALLDLAAQLPAAVLADLLGLHQNTAARWMHQAGGDWSRYAAELARHPHQP